MIKTLPMLDRSAKGALLMISPQQACQILGKVIGNEDLANPSAYAYRAARSKLKGHEVKEGNGRGRGRPQRRYCEEDDQAYAEEGPEWLNLSLSEWIRDMDICNGQLLQYEEALKESYDSLEEIVKIYVFFNGEHVMIDSKFFQALGIKKLIHRHTMEKWFEDRRSDLASII